MGATLSFVQTCLTWNSKHVDCWYEIKNGGPHVNLWDMTGANTHLPLRVFAVNLCAIFRLTSFLWEPFIWKVQPEIFQNSKNMLRKYPRFWEEEYLIFTAFSFLNPILNYKMFYMESEYM